jgi:putative transposase
MVEGYGIRQEFITPHSPQDNGMVKRLIRTMKEQCLFRHRFETQQQHAACIRSDWIQFYKTRWLRQALRMRSAQRYAHPRKPGTP